MLQLVGCGPRFLTSLIFSPTSQDSKHENASLFVSITQEKEQNVVLLYFHYFVHCYWPRCTVALVFKGSQIQWEVRPRFYTMHVRQFKLLRGDEEDWKE